MIPNAGSQIRCCGFFLNRNKHIVSPFGMANIGVHFEFLVLGAVKVKCSEVFVKHIGSLTVKARPPMLAQTRLRGKLGRPFVCF